MLSHYPIDLFHSILILKTFIFFSLVDVIKVRLQLANPAMAASKSSMKAGLLTTTVNIYRKEGVRAYYSGLKPAVIRGLFYGGVRLGQNTNLFS